MGRKATTGWVIGAFFLGYILGDDPDPAPKAPAPTPGVTDIIKADKPLAALPKPKPQAAKPKIQPPKPVARPVVNTAPKPQPVKPAFKPKSMYVDADRLNVRNGPGLENKQVWTLKRDEKVSVVGQSGEWFRIKSSRYDGWVFGTYLTPKPAPKTVKLTPAKPVKPKVSDNEIRKILIRRSIAAYRGRCPCPYNTKSNGHRCGGNSAYSRPGGAAPLCYPSDITAGMVRDYRSRL